MKLWTLALIAAPLLAAAQQDGPLAGVPHCQRTCFRDAYSNLCGTEDFDRECVCSYTRTEQRGHMLRKRLSQTRSCRSLESDCDYGNGVYNIQHICWPNRNDATTLNGANMALAAAGLMGGALFA